MAVPDFERIEGKYQILEKLGGGGMGTVYKVRHLLLDEIRVVKVIRPHLEGDAKLRDRFLREARSAVQLRHPNIATVYDFTIDEDGVAFMVMECINGEDLKRLVKRNERLPIALGMEVGIQTLRALKYLHGRNYIHRDISPDNLMLSRDVDGRILVKLIDLGVAKSMESSEELTRDGMFVGKFRYGAPEQFGGAGLTVDHRTDLYSLGIVLYEVMTGYHPFPGENEREIVGGHLFHPPRAFAETDSSRRLTDELRQLLLRAMEKSSEDRFQSAEEFGAALRTARDTWEDPEDDSFIELSTSATPAGAELASDGSTQMRLDHEFAPNVTPPPISAVRVIEKTGVGAGESVTSAGTLVSRGVVSPRVPRGKPLVLGAAVLAALVALLGFWMARDGGVREEAPAESLAEPETEPDPVSLLETPEPGVEQAPDTVSGSEPPSGPGAAAPERVSEPEIAEPAPSPRADLDPAPRAPTPNPRAEALVSDARAAFNDGRDEVTLNLLKSALAIEPSDVGAHRLLGELAKSAESKAARARRSAEDAGASTRAATEFSQASAAQQSGSRSLSSERFEEAIVSYWSSVALYGRAAKSAEEVAQREAAEAARQAEARRDADREAELAARTERERQAARERAATPPPTTPAPRVDERPAILAAIDAFSIAHESLAVSRVLEVWPSLSGERLQAVTRSLEGAREIEMDISGCVVREGGGTATAQCTLEQSYRPKRGTRQSIRRSVTFQLARANDRWVVEDY